MAECLKKETLQEKGRPARMSEERRFIAEMNREKALKIKALKLEMKLKQHEIKQDEIKKRKEQETLDSSTRNYEKQQKAKCRRFVLEQEENYKKKIQEEIRQKKQETGNNSRTDFTKNTGIPDVDA